MNGSDLFNALSETEEKYLSEAENVSGIAGEFKKQKNKKIKTAVCILGCFIIAVSAAFLLRGMNKAPVLPEGTKAAAEIGGPETVHDLLPTGSAEIAMLPAWDDRSTLERFTELSFGGSGYITCGRETDPSFFGEALGTAVVSGFDVYTDAVFTEEVGVFAVKNVSSACCLGVKFSDGTCTVYHSLDYAPETLGQFLDDLGLRGYLTFGKAYASYFDAEKTYHDVDFDDFDDAIVWETLLSDPSVKNTPDAERIVDKLGDIGVSVPALGIENLGMWFTADGYLCTNVLGTLKCFYVGEASTKAMEAYLYANVPYNDVMPFASSEETVTAEETSAGAPAEESAVTVVCTTAAP